MSTLVSHDTQSDKAAQLDNNQNSKTSQMFVTINTLVSIGEKEQSFPIQFSISTKSTIRELIARSIEYFNKERFEFVDENNKPMFILHFVSSPDDYELKPSKKNGRPKLDYPPFYYQSVLCETQKENFSLLFKAENLQLNPPTSRRRTGACRGIDCIVI